MATSTILIARLNFLMSFVEYLEDRWKREPTEKELEEIANIISWHQGINAIQARIEMHTLQLDNQYSFRVFGYR